MLKEANPQYTMEDYLKKARQAEKETGKLYHSYKKIISKKISLKRGKTIAEVLQKLEEEKEDLCVQLNIVLSPGFMKRFDEQVETFKTQFESQKSLDFDIRSYMKEIKHLEHQVRRADKEIVEITLKSTSEAAYKKRLHKSLKMLDSLEAQFHIARRMQSTILTINRDLRLKICHMLSQRTRFNSLWQDMVSKLAADRKFLIDLLEQTTVALDRGSELYQKMKNLNDGLNQDTITKKSEIQELMRNRDGLEQRHQFLEVKGKYRQITSLEGGEVKRRQNFNATHVKKLNEYNNIIQQILEFFGVKSIVEAISKFKQQETLYYSLFNLINSQNLQIEGLKNNFHQITANIESLKVRNDNLEYQQKKKINDLRAELEKEQNVTSQKLKYKKEINTELETIFRRLLEVFQLLQCDNTPLMFLLDDNTKIHIHNVKHFLKILEKRLNTVIAYVFTNEKAQGKLPATVRNIDKNLKNPTPIDNIVLAQECTECAEGEDINPYDESFVAPLAVEEIKTELREKATAPEMQYRLHSVAQCRLPRSRMIASKME